MAAIGLIAAAATNLGVQNLWRRLESDGLTTTLRRNYRGEDVSLRGGLAVGAGALIGTLTTVPAAGAASLATATALATGIIDDWETVISRQRPTTAKGLSGHLHALGRGEVSTGIIKLAGISGAALVAAALLPRRFNDPRRASLDYLTRAAAIAGGANLINLFDLRPGRALKVATIIAALNAYDPGARPASAVVLSQVIPVLGADLKARTMLGDSGANVLGALLGFGAANARPRQTLTFTAATVALILAAERVSFSEIIATNPGLAWLDGVGRGRH